MLICFSASSCISGGLDASTLKQKTVAVNINKVKKKEKQWLFPDINFTCNGSITKWIVGALDDTGTPQPELQIWRHNSSGVSRYDKVDFTRLTPNETNDTNVHEYYLETPLEFQEGDILGVYQPMGKAALTVYYQASTGPANLFIDQQASPDTILATDLQDYDYPLVTMEIIQNTIAQATPLIALSVSTHPSLHIRTSLTRSTMPAVSVDHKPTSAGRPG